ncbi:MAG TPA: transglycosylase SLT domain-containing protein [Polyangiaceae bacterium]|nr:transglycosylase SLT domain-containing protein [Polyangiaceae bacterium]
MAAEALKPLLTLLVCAPFAASLAACEGRNGTAPEGRPPAQPSLVQVASAIADAGDASASPAPGMPRLAVVLDDPRLAAARERTDAKDDFAAARELDRVLADAVLDGPTKCLWTYVAGRLHMSAGDASDAVAAFDRAAGGLAGAGSGAGAGAGSGAGAGAGAAGVCAGEALAPYARLREAEALVRAGRYEDALAWARSVGDEIPFHDETKLTLADALSGKGDRAGALAIWRPYLAANPHGLRWVDVSLQLATALIDGVDGPPESAAKEAVELTTRVLVEAPSVADKLAVADLRQRAALASRAPLRPLALDERARQAQAWLDASQPKHAREAAADVLAAIPKSDAAHRGVACSAAIVRAQATPKAKSDDAAAAWGTAIARCESDDALVTALYYGARASVSAHNDGEAIARFEKVEKLFPKHRLADDARFRAAMVLQDQGDDARAIAMLASVPDDYPEGDMAVESLFRIAIDKLEAHDLTSAMAAVDRAIAIAPTPAAARRPEYFRARWAEQTGATDDAKHRYAALVSDAPLDYYMLLAYARLRALDDALARTTLEAAIARDASDPALALAPAPAPAPAPAAHPEFASPAFARMVSLLEVGEVDAARREASTGSLVGDGVDPEVLWNVGWLFDHAGAPEVGHAYARGRAAHWPAGRWKLAWEVAFPRAFDATVTHESDGARIPAALTWGIMREESAYNPEAKSIANAIGLMQLMSGTARLVARDPQLPAPLPWDDASLHRPAVSIALGARLLGSLRTSFPSHPAFAIAAYNAGSNAVRRWLVQHGSDDFDVFVERIPFEETRNYVKRVLASEATYAFLYAPAALDEILAFPARLTAPPTVTTP